MSDKDEILKAIAQLGVDLRAEMGNLHAEMLKGFSKVTTRLERLETSQEQLDTASKRGVANSEALEEHERRIGALEVATK